MVLTDPDSLRQVLALAKSEAEAKVQAKVVDTFTDDAGVHKVLVVPGEVPRDIVAPHPPAPRKHQFLSLDSFVAFLCSTHVERAVVFVGRDLVVADLAYGRKFGYSEHAFLKLEYAEEFQAVQRLRAGVGQKELWTMLATSLDGCFPPEMLLKISQASVKSTRERDRNIDILGLSSGGASYNVSITSNGTAAEAAIPTFWPYEGRIYGCVEDKGNLALRLELGVDDEACELGFKFHAVRLEKVLEDARAAVCAALVAGCAEKTSISIYQGLLS